MNPRTTHTFADEHRPAGAGRLRVDRHSLARRGALKPLHALLILVLVGILLAWVGHEISQQGPDRSGTPEPWYYDEANNRHWHPGHGHWHEGPPPPEAAGPQQPGQTPEPWHYDEANDRHWHPGHAHWHDGPPPPPEAR